MRGRKARIYGRRHMSNNILSSDVWGRDEIASACTHADPSLPSVASMAVCPPCPNRVAARSLSIDGLVRLVPFTPRRSEGKGTEGRSLGAGGKSYSQVRKIVNLIDIPELEPLASPRKQRKDGNSNRQQTMVFAESYQIVWKRAFCVPIFCIGTAYWAFASR